MQKQSQKQKGISISATWRTLLGIIVSIVMVVSMLWLLPASSFANPEDAVPPNADETVGIYKGGTTHDPDDNEVGIAAGDQVRDEQGRVSQLSTTTHNPYNKQIRLSIDIGSEFADFKGCEFTEGYIIKVTPGGIVELPALRARDGYYFVGWGQGGVSYEPIWDPFVTEVEMSDDTSNGKNTTIYALFADEQGNGFCTCGAYEEGIYAERMDEIRAADAEYDETLGYMGTPGSNVQLQAAVLVLLIIVCVGGLAFAAWRDHVDAKNGDTEFL